MARKKQKRCRSCKKSPVWRGGDVKNPGPYCKRCYHKGAGSAKPPSQKSTGLPDPDYYHCPMCGIEAEVLEGGTCVSCGFCFDNALYEWFVR